MDAGAVGSHDYPAQPGRTGIAQEERAQLADLLVEVGPAAPTLCEGWDTHHLAAHLVLREGNPVGMVTAARPGRGDQAVDECVATRDYDSLVEALRTGPPRLSLFALPGADRMMNMLEFLVHHEDVRRAATDWTPRPLPEWVHEKVWGQLRWLARARLRGAPVGVAMTWPTTDKREFVVKKMDVVRLSGEPVELALFCFGRRTVAQVEAKGDPGDVARLMGWLGD